MSRRRRVLFIVNALEFDSPTRLTLAVAKAARIKGWDVEVFSWSRGGTLEGELRDSGILFAVGEGGMAESALRLRSIMHRFDPDLVHTALVRPTLGYALSRLLSNRCLPLWVAGDHGVHEWHEKGRLRGALMEVVMPAVLHLADEVVTVSASARRDLLRRGIAAEKVSVISNGVDVRRFYPGSKAERQQVLQRIFPRENVEEILVVGSAGNLRGIKGYDILLRAVPRVLQAVPRARFIIWGQGPEETVLKELAKSLRIESAVAFVGFERQIELKLPLLDVYVQPSRVESFGLGAAEAMACGVSVVVSEVGGLSDLVQDEESGLKFQTGNDVGLANQIIRLLKNRPLAHRLGDEGRLRILEHYSQQGMTNAMLRLYEQLLQRREAQRERH